MEKSPCNSDSDNESTTPDIAAAAKNIALHLLPVKSRLKYEKQYEMFETWSKARDIKSYTESVLLTYFTEKASVMKSSTLWSIYSMLKAVLLAKRGIDISQYKTLLAYLKKQAQNYRAKKSKTFREEHIQKFICEAPDDLYLLKKVVLIIGIAGACRRDELVKIKLSDIEDKGSLLIITVPETETNKSRCFTVRSGSFIDILQFYRKYIALRPLDSDTPERLFLNYHNRKCSKQVVGMNTIAKVPKDIAEFLELADSDLYTGHCFRRTSANLMADGGRGIIRLDLLGQWHPTRVPKRYLENSINNIDIHNMTGSSTFSVEVDTYQVIQESLEEPIQQSNYEISQESLQEPSQEPPPVYDTTTLSDKSRKRSIRDTQIQLMEACTSALNSQKELTEFDLIGMNVAKKLHRMDATQAIYAESLINAVLLKGLKNELCENMTISTDVYREDGHTTNNHNRTPTSSPEPSTNNSEESHPNCQNGELVN
ncbi:unnamed protein product [Acanthoscelides obtectus]|uniref:Tyr recombinase domain-containing protein n=1 Tax=Acanthoscelides obtectus TaxID=200917 RepID=A0A9P0LYY1_ACAOB|nr:unnamed protein product [Acanthoscelides obtectus]CAK1672190.1 hypothetical protein AOBTE_LOCUS28707 [Acanthoscelides obtectus]